MEIRNKRVSAEETTVLQKVLMQCISFSLGEQLYALSMDAVESILFARKIFLLPNTHDKLLGVYNLRGNIIPVYSLRRLLSLSDPYQGSRIVDEDDRYVIVVKYQRNTFGLMVDTIYKHLEVLENEFQGGDHIARWSEHAVVSGVILKQEQEILFIDMDRLFLYISSLQEKK
ncbi:chemotaxis protein CheW [Thermospira aquatica]|uniref:Chemotaxis protein CheW n=1 Tax=Thermospira aquatica TaxID=2828656 RepID=A0AAX3BBZ9_9SPIR|nr:chemotaxis protein CheW [Thermospira aquatica]URA09519.1 chemotaxis protein CheW [Thermospira aquatica]